MSKKLSAIKDFLRSDERTKKQASEKLKKLAALTAKPGEKTDKIAMNRLANIIGLQHSSVKRIWFCELGFIPPAVLQIIEMDIKKYEHEFEKRDAELRSQYRDGLRHMGQAAPEIRSAMGSAKTHEYG